MTAQTDRYSVGELAVNDGSPNGAETWAVWSREEDGSSRYICDRSTRAECETIAAHLNEEWGRVVAQEGNRYVIRLRDEHKWLVMPAGKATALEFSPVSARGWVMNRDSAQRIADQLSLAVDVVPVEQ